MSKKAWIKQSVIELNRQARELRHEGRQEEALEVYRQAVRLDRDNLITLTNLGNLHAERREDAIAFHYLWRAYDVDRKGVKGCEDPYILVSLASLHAIRDEYPEALRKFGEALKIDMHDKLTRIRLGNLYMKQGELKLAEEQFKMAGHKPEPINHQNLSDVESSFVEGVRNTLFPDPDLPRCHGGDRLDRRQARELAFACE